MSDAITITLNERRLSVSPGTTLHDLRDAHLPEADVVVFNGAPVRDNCALSDGDEIALIARGRVPSKAEMESLMASRHTPGVHKILKAATVGIAGLGGLGSAIAIALARIGVGKLILVDFDVVEPSNLNRQQFFVDQLGKYKTDALVENLVRINPYVTLEPHTVRLTPDNISEIFSAVDVLAEAFDAADQKAMLLEQYGIAYPGRPMVMATGLAGHMPSNTILTRKMGGGLVIVGDLVTAAQPGTGLMAPRVGVAAHHQANAVLRILLGEDPAG